MGNGWSLHIWMDKWLTKPFTFKLTSNPANVPHDAKVSLLIDPYTWAWRADMVQQFFSPTDAFAILSIPLSFWLPCDWMVWAFPPKGDFPMCSDYKLALEMVHDENSRGASNNQSNKLLWKTIWRLTFQTKSSPLLGVRVKISYRQKPTYITGKWLIILFVRHVVWGLRVVSMYYGIVRKRRRFGSFLVFPLKSVGPIFQKLWIFYGIWSPGKGWGMTC